MDLSGNNKNKITGKKYQPVMSITGLNDQGLRYIFISSYVELFDNFELSILKIELIPTNNPKNRTYPFI